MFDIREIAFPPLSDAQFDREGIRKKHMVQQGQIAVKNLLKNDFSAHFCESASDALQTLLSLIPPSSLVGCGDSHTLFALNAEDALNEMNCTVIPHTCAVNGNAFDQNVPGYTILGDRKITREILRSYLVADVFLLSANAVTLDGQIVNIDGAGNRIAGSIYGSDRIIVIAGANKIARDLPAALDRIHDVAAQMNNIKYEKEMPCNKAGYCVDCRDSRRDCNITSIIHKQPEESDFHVIIVAEELGF
ncbi:MAG: lactate utilization protein [Sphaerochaetaceae bacterium]|nr:lactate utilization protein [Sphaerochaetaceae bacterium]